MNPMECYRLIECQEIKISNWKVKTLESIFSNPNFWTEVFDEDIKDHILCSSSMTEMFNTMFFLFCNKYKNYIKHD